MAKKLKTNANKPEQKLSLRHWQLKWLAAAATALMTAPTANCTNPPTLITATYHDGCIVLTSLSTDARYAKYLNTLDDTWANTDGFYNNVVKVNGQNLRVLPYQPNKHIFIAAGSVKKIAENDDLDAMLILHENILNRPGTEQATISPPTKFESETKKLVTPQRA
jgi:hypothetical protein